MDIPIPYVPAITVIIPVCNGEKTIKQAILSVLEQTFTDYNILVIANGCTDNTVGIINDIESEKIRIIQYSKKLGISLARNRGIALSVNSKFFTFLDADDYWDKDKLKDQLAIMQDNPMVAIAYSWVDAVDEDGKFIGKCSRSTARGLILPQMLLSNFIDCGSNALVRRDLFNELGYSFKEDLVSAEDWDVWIRLSMRYEFECVKKVQVYYRQVSGSLSNNFPKHTEAALNVIDRIYEEVPCILKPLRPSTIQNFLQYITYKALKAKPSRQNGLICIQYMKDLAFISPKLMREGWYWKPIIRSFIYLMSPGKAIQICDRFSRYTAIDGLMLNNCKYQED